MSDRILSVKQLKAVLIRAGAVPGQVGGALGLQREGKFPGNFDVEEYSRVNEFSFRHYACAIDFSQQEI
jgi:hypothetical protein